MSCQFKRYCLAFQAVWFEGHGMRIVLNAIFNSEFCGASMSVDSDCTVHILVCIVRCPLWPCRNMHGGGCWRMKNRLNSACPATVLVWHHSISHAVALVSRPSPCTLADNQCLEIVLVRVICGSNWVGSQHIWLWCCVCCACLDIYVQNRIVLTLAPTSVKT